MMESMRAPIGRRWVILGLLTCFGTISYIERMNLTIVSRFIRDEYRLNNTEIGWSFSVFLISYTLAQLPSGALVDRYGARRVLAVSGLLWFLITLLMGIFVGRLAISGFQVVASLIIGRFLLGLVEAPTFPAAASAIARWFPPGARGVPNAVIQATTFGGQALTLILLAALTAYLGWRNALFASAVPALLIAAIWWVWGCDEPERDRRVSVQELSYIKARQPPTPTPTTAASRNGRFEILKTGKLVWLSVGYFFHGYVSYLFFFWFYIYLVDARHFPVSEGGLVGSAPTAMAALCTVVGGPLSDFVTRKTGPLVGRRWLITLAGLSGAGFLLVGAYAQTMSIAIGGFVLAVGTRGLVEASFWSMVNDIGGENTGLVGGTMNGFGNLGGVVSTALAAPLVAAAGWSLAMTVGAVAAALSGLALFAIHDPERRTTRQPRLDVQP